MEDNIYLLVKVRIEHTHVKVHDAIYEIQNNSVCTVTDTETVKIIETEIMDYKLKS
ncbi:hypothetical protein ACFGVS_03135 [Mucilaginibacter sp. AW1-7]|uniref:hypothetical protein n=1 Tax=Mucilaginibacter sp. AW1-7 TaxID=3349874 RepID=UPI003F740F41